MRKYEDSTVNERGDVISSVSVTVYLTGTSTLATLYSDDGVTTTTNPVTSDSNGKFSFYVDDGRYDLTFSKTGITTRTISDVEIIDFKAHPFVYPAMYQSGTATPPDTQPTVSVESTSGGSIDTQTYYYVVTYFNRNGETTQSPVRSFAASSGSANKIKVVVGDHQWRSGCAFFRCYVGQSSSGPFYLQTPAANTYSTTGHIVPGDIILTSLTFSGTQPPSTNTATIDALQVALNATSTYASNAVNGMLMVTGTHTLTTPLIVSTQQRIFGVSAFRKEQSSSSAGTIISSWTDADLATVMLPGLVRATQIEGCQIIGAGHALMIWENATGGNQNIIVRGNSIRSTGSSNTYSAVHLRGWGYDYMFENNYLRGDKACVSFKNHSGSGWNFSGSRWDAGGTYQLYSESSVTDPDRAANRASIPNAVRLKLKDVLCEVGTGVGFDLTNCGFIFDNVNHSDPNPGASTTANIIIGVDANGSGASAINGVIEDSFFAGHANYTDFIKIASNNGNTFTGLAIINTDGASSANACINYNSVTFPVVIVGGQRWEPDEGASPVRFRNQSASGQCPTIIGVASDGTVDTQHAMNQFCGGFRFVQHNDPTKYWGAWWSSAGVLDWYNGDPDTTANRRMQWNFNNNRITVFQSDGSTTLFRFDGSAGVNIVESNATHSFNTISLDVANRDVNLTRASANVLQLASGDSFQPASSGQGLGASGNRWALNATTGDFSSNITAALDIDLTRSGTNPSFTRPGSSDKILFQKAGGGAFGGIEVSGPIVASSARIVKNQFATFSDADTTPSVLSGNLFKASNTGATTITAFDDGTNGQEIRIIFTNGNTTIQAGANMKLAAGLNFVGTADDTLSLVFDGTSWFETSRSVNA